MNEITILGVYDNPDVDPDEVDPDEKIGREFVIVFDCGEEDK